MARRQGWQRALGNALSMATNMAAAIALGYFAGKYLDKWLGTDPWLTLLLFLLGVATGLKIVYDQAFGRSRKTGRHEEDKESDNNIKIRPGDQVIESLKVARESLKEVQEKVKDIYPSQDEEKTGDSDPKDKTKGEDGQD